MLTDTVKQLRSHKSDLQGKIKNLESEISKVEEAIAVLLSVGEEGASAVARQLARRRRTRKISAAESHGSGPPKVALVKFKKRWRGENQVVRQIQTEFFGRRIARFVPHRRLVGPGTTPPRLLARNSPIKTLHEQGDL